ncbi:MAG: amidohydrolase family protein [Tetrasphaera sp.]
MTPAPPHDLAPAVLVRGARLVPVGGQPAPAEPVDLRIRDGLVTEIAPTLNPQDEEEVHHAEGRWAIPGLWDHHVHMAQWANTLTRVDMTGTGGPEEVTERLAAHLAVLPAGDTDSVVTGFGHRSALWTRQPTVAELDAVSGRHPVVLVSGDAHNGWLNTAALRLLDAPATTGALRETDWFPVFARLDSLPGAAEAARAAYDLAVDRAASVGVVGIGDMEFGPAHRDWPRRFARGVRGLRVRAATYPEGLDAVIAEGLATGDDLGETGGQVRMGPLKIISDGSLNTRSAYCREPYADSATPAEARGRPNYDAAELTDLFARARSHGLTVAVHAIGDAAVERALDCFAATGATGAVEHAQLMRTEDVSRMAALGVVASVQPAHLLDDRDVIERCWPDRIDRCFPLRSMIDAGVILHLGSDAPVSPLDPWLAMAAAVYRSGDDRDPWASSQQIGAAEALAASTDDQRTLAVGSRGDIALLDADPLAATDSPVAAAEVLGSMTVSLTLLGGRVTHAG